MIADDYKFTTEVYVDGELVNLPNLPYRTFSNAQESASAIIDAEWSEGQKLKVIFNLVAVYYNNKGDIIRVNQEKRLCEIPIN